MTTWKVLINEGLEIYNEKFSDIVSITLTEEELNKQFNGGYGGSEGIPFTAWTTNRVYFPAVYDGAEWVDSASRNPDGIPTKHVGGG